MEGNREARIDWQYAKAPDLTLGVGATKSDKALVLLAGLGVPLLLWLLAWRHLPQPWAWWQWAVAVLAAFDIAGGVAANALAAQKRATHSTVQPVDPRLLKSVKRHPWLFPAVHVHPFVLVFGFGGSWAWAALWYLVPVAVVLTMHRLPLYLHRPLAFTAMALALPAAIYGWPAPVGLEWFAPLFVLKLVCCHAVREEPYAP